MGYDSAQDMQAVAKLLRKVDVNQTGFVTEAEFVRHFVNWRMADIADKLKEATGQGTSVQVLAITWRTFEAVVPPPAADNPAGIASSPSRRLPAVTVERVAVTRVTEYLTAWWNKHGSNPDVCLWLDVAGWDSSFAAALGDALALHGETMADAAIYQTQKVEALPATHHSDILVAPAALALDAAAAGVQSAPPPTPPHAAHGAAQSAPPRLSPPEDDEAPGGSADPELRAQLLVHLVSLSHVPLSRYDQQGDVLALLRHAWPGHDTGQAPAAPSRTHSEVAGSPASSSQEWGSGPTGTCAACCCAPPSDEVQGGGADGEVKPACINSAALVACGLCWYMGCAPRCCHRALTAAVEPPLGEWVMSDAALPLGAGLWGKGKLLRHTPKLEVEQLSILVHSDRIMVSQRPAEEQPPAAAPAAAAAPAVPLPSHGSQEPDAVVVESTASDHTTAVPAGVGVATGEAAGAATGAAAAAAAAPNRVKQLRRADHSTRALLGAGRSAPSPAATDAPHSAPAAAGGARSLWWRVEPSAAFKAAREAPSAVSVGNVMDSLLCRLVCGDPSSDPIRAMGAKSMAIELAEALAQVNFSVRDRLLDWRNLLEAHIRHSAARHHVDHLYALGKVATRYTQQIAQMKRALRPEAFELSKQLPGAGEGDAPLSATHVRRGESHGSALSDGAGADRSGGGGGSSLGEFFREEDMEVRELFDDHAFIHEDMSGMVRSVEALQQLYKTAQNDQMNRILFALTLVTTVMLPGQFLTGVYGMNFETGMYELELGWGYAGLFWGVVLVCGSAVAVLFVRRYWALL